MGSRLAVLFLIAGCAASPRDPGEPVLVSGQGYRGVILPFNAMQGETYLDAESYWAPSAEQVRAMEERLPRFLLGEKPESDPELGTKVAEYYRQYVGITINGRRLIYGNFVHNTAWRESLEDGIDYHRQLMLVDDGGSWFFQVEYDVERRAFIELWINGVA